MSEKLQKVLARAGFASRRAVEEWISAGRIKVNGKVATLGDRVTDSDKIAIDDKVIHADRLEQQPCRVLAYHKPVGEVCTRSDPEGRPTIFDKMPKLKRGQWIAVGRLDINTSGLILLTNDGELANLLMHPSSEIEREYAVRVFGQVDDEVIKHLREGVLLDDGVAKFDNILDSGGDGSNHWYHVVLKEGRNREVRRLWESQGVAVSRLVRVRYGTFNMQRSLRPGKVQELNIKEINVCRNWVQLESVQKQTRTLEKRQVEVKRTTRSTPSKKQNRSHTPRARRRRVK